MNRFCVSCLPPNTKNVTAKVLQQHTRQNTKGSTQRVWDSWMLIMYKTLQNLGSESSFKTHMLFIDILEFYDESLVIQPLHFLSKINYKRRRRKKRASEFHQAKNNLEKPTKKEKSCEMCSSFCHSWNSLLYHAQKAHPVTHCDEDPLMSCNQGSMGP